MKNKNITYMTQAAMIAAIYVVHHLCRVAAFLVRRSAGSYFGGAYNSSGLYSGCHSRIICRMPDR